MKTRIATRADLPLKKCQGILFISSGDYFRDIFVYRDEFGAIQWWVYMEGLQEWSDETHRGWYENYEGTPTDIDVYRVVGYGVPEDFSEMILIDLKS